MHRRRAAAGATIAIGGDAAVVAVVGVVSVVAALASLASGCADDGGAATAVQVAGVEAIGCDRPQPRSGVGTFVADDMLLTAAHVVEGDLRDLRVGGAPAVVVGIDHRTDLALVAIVAGHDDSIGDRESPRWVVTPPSDFSPGPVRVVTPEGSSDVTLLRTLTLRVKDVTADTTAERQALELDVVVDEGDSGSAVVDADGNLLGVVVLRRPAAGVSYASAVPSFAELLDPDLYQAVRADPLARPGVCT
jgi:S1-C subfamily serine protease